MPFPYVQQTWTDGASSASAARLTVMEAGIALAGVAGVAASPPSSPTDGMLWRMSPQTGSYWLFQYVSAEATYKWVFVGGAPMHHTILTTQSRNNGTYGDLTTVGPTLTVARAGDYEVAFGARVIPPLSVNDRARLAVKRGAAAASDDDCVSVGGPSNANGQDSSLARVIVMTALAASTELRVQYRNDAAAGNADYSLRYLTVRPLRVI